MPAEESRLKGKYHPLQFINSQRMPVPPPNPLPKQKVPRMKSVEPNREVQFDVVHHPWMRKDSQLTEEASSVTLATAARSRGPTKKVNGLLKSTTVRRRNRDAWDSLMQKDMVEGTSSAEDISPSKFGALTSPERKELRTKKSPKKKPRRIEVVALVEEVRPEELPVNEPEEDQEVAAPPTETNIGTQFDQQIGSGRTDSTSQASVAVNQLENSRTASSGYRERHESDESSQDSSFHHTEDDLPDLLNSQREIQEQIIPRTVNSSALVEKEKMFLFMSVTPVRGPPISLAEDSPDYRSGRIACSEEERSFRQSLQLRD